VRIAIAAQPPAEPPAVARADTDTSTRTGASASAVPDQPLAAARWSEQCVV